MLRKPIICLTFSNRSLVGFPPKICGYYVRVFLQCQSALLCFPLLRFLLSLLCIAEVAFLIIVLLSSLDIDCFGICDMYLRIKSLFFNIYDVMKTVGGVNIP